MAALFSLAPSLWLESQQPPRAIQSLPPQIPVGAILEGHRPAGHLHPSPGHSLALLANTARTRPSPTGIPQPLPQPWWLLPGPLAKQQRWGMGRYSEGKVLTIAPRGVKMGYDFLVFTSPFWTRQR